jgi:excisionase family DNA binding protein
MSPQFGCQQSHRNGAFSTGRHAPNGGAHERSPEEEAMSEPQRLPDVLAEDPLLLTPEEAARLLRVGRTTVYALMKAGDLRPVHIGRSCRLARAELERYVRLLQNPPQVAPARHRRRSRPEPATQTGLFDPDPPAAA